MFDPLDFGQVRKIVAQQVERVRARMADRKIGLHVGDDATQLLCEAGYDPAFGARPVKRAVQHLLETALAQAILRGDVGEDETAVVGVDANEGNKRLFVTKFRRRFRQCRNRRPRTTRTTRRGTPSRLRRRRTRPRRMRRSSNERLPRVSSDATRSRVVSFFALPEDYGTAHISDRSAFYVSSSCAPSPHVCRPSHT